MKTPLRYQATCYDCGTTSLINAFLYLLEREEIPVKVIRYISEVTCDKHLGTEGGMGGTSFAALSFLVTWINHYAQVTGLPVSCEALHGDAVTMRGSSRVVRCLEEGGVAVVGCCLGVDHYVLLTGLEGDKVRIFDSYYSTWPFEEFEVAVQGVEQVCDQPHTCNRLVERWVMDEPAGTLYSLAAQSGRDAVLFWHT